MDFDEKKALEEELEMVRAKRFDNNMCDHWSDYNYKIDRECFAKEQELEERLAQLKKEQK